MHSGQFAGQLCNLVILAAELLRGCLQLLFQFLLPVQSGLQLSLQLGCKFLLSIGLAGWLASWLAGWPGSAGGVERLHGRLRGGSST